MLLHRIQSMTEIPFLSCNLIINIPCPFGKSFLNLCGNARNLKTFHVPTEVKTFLNFITELTTLHSKHILVNSAAVTNRSAYFGIFQSLVNTVLRFCYIANHIMRMQLRIKKPACVMLKTCINYVPVTS